VNFKTLTDRIPEFCLSHWLLRIPLAVVFIQQGLNKIPVDALEAESWGLPYIVWWFVSWGELGAGVGLLVGGLLALHAPIVWLADLITRFSGFVVGSVMTGVIWMSQPASFMDVILYDHFHVMLWFGGLFFALRGTRT
jgi:putative oxidoreductase